MHDAELADDRNQVDLKIDPRLAWFFQSTRCSILPPCSTLPRLTIHTHPVVYKWWSYQSDIEILAFWSLLWSIYIVQPSGVLRSKVHNKMHYLAYCCYIFCNRSAHDLHRYCLFSLDNEEKEFIELRGETVTQALLALWGSAYVLTDGKLACLLIWMISLLSFVLYCDMQLVIYFDP